MADDNVSSQILDAALTQTVNVARLSEGQLKPILDMLGRLEVELIADLEDNVGKSAFTMERLNALLRQTKQTIASAYDAISVISDEGLVDIAKITVSQTVKAIDNAIGAALTSVAWSPAQIARAATDTVIQGSFAGDWWAQQGDTLRQRFQQEMQLGQLRGETVQDLVNRVRGTRELDYRDGIMTASYNQAAALVRTSALGVSNMARMDTYAANDTIIKGVQWHATLDPRTCPICIALDGLRWDYPEGDGKADYADYEPVGHDKDFSPAPAHWNCRCVVIPITKSWKELAGAHGNSAAAEAADAVPVNARASMDGQVAGTMTFDEWLQAKDAAFQDEVLGPARADAWRSGALDLTSLTDQSNNPLTIADLKAAGVDMTRAAPTPATSELTTGERSMYDQLKEMLQTEKAVSQKMNPNKASNASYWVTFPDKTEWLYKPAEGERSFRSAIDNKTGAALWQREVANSDLAGLLDMTDIVPSTGKYQGEKGVGSAQLKVPDSKDAADVSKPYRNKDDVALSAAWDYFTGQQDRHPQNFRIANSDGGISLTDNGYSFPKAMSFGKDPKAIYDFRSHPFMEAQTQNFDIPDEVMTWQSRWPDIEKYLSSHGFTTTEIEGAHLRLNELAAANTFRDIDVSVTQWEHWWGPRK